MNYPNDFDIPTFPAGRVIAFSRSVSVWIAIVFFLIIVSCELVLLLNHSKRRYPFLISTDPTTAEWTVIAYPEKTIKITQDEIIQGKLVRNYVEYWFSIYKNNQINEALWQKCTTEDCRKPEQYNPKNRKCALFCTSDTELFTHFTNDVLPEYQNRIAQKSETIHVIKQLPTHPSKKQLMIPKSENTTYLWQSYVTLESSENGTFEVLAFVELGYDANNYPATLGYYVKDFNAYRMVVIQE